MVYTEMGDHFLEYYLGIRPNPSQLSLTIPPCVATVSTGCGEWWT